MAVLSFKRLLPYYNTLAFITNIFSDFVFFFFFFSTLKLKKVFEKKIVIKKSRKIIINLCYELNNKIIAKLIEKQNKKAKKNKKKIIKEMKKITLLMSLTFNVLMHIKSYYDGIISF